MPNAQGLALIKIIEEDIFMLNLAISHQKWRMAAYLVQQVIEKSIKLVLMSQGVPDNQILSHDINFLRLMLYNNFGINVPSNVISTANTVTFWEAQARYDLNFCAKPSDIKGCAKIAKDYFKIITSN